jgi:alkaline phosphatase D
MAGTTRRRFLVQTAPITLASWLGACGGPGVTAITAPGGTPEATLVPPGSTFEFRHGVASGDPLADAVILWTRVTPVAPVAPVPSEAAPVADTTDAGTAETNGSEPSGTETSRADAGATRVSVDWSIALDPGLTRVVQTGRAETDADADYTVKVDVRGLAPGVTHYYRFGVGQSLSPIGRTRTLPQGHVEQLRLAVTSCANHPQGYFHAYRKIAERADLDLVLCLGDYIYEFGNGTFGDGAPLGRIPDPDHEILSLDDYRRRHAQYKLDPDLQELHRQHPAVAVWDDHELADNAWRGGAANHTPAREGDWEVRKAAAIRAFHEWLPIRSNPDDLIRIYRAFSFGDLIDLIMLDTRVIGRDRSPNDVCDVAEVNDPSRSLLGAEQEAWFFAQLASSRDRGARWRVIGQQVAFGQFLGNPPVAGCIGSTDKWGAFSAARGRVLDTLDAGKIDNVVILTGDSHSSWGLDIARDPFDPNAYDAATGRGSLAVECICPGITSPGITDARAAATSEVLYKATHPHIKYANQHEQGYVLIDLTHERLRAEWYHVSPVREPAALEHLGGAAVSLAGQNHLNVPTELEPEPGRAESPELAPASL